MKCLLFCTFSLVFGSVKRPRVNVMIISSIGGPLTIPYISILVLILSKLIIAMSVFHLS